VVHHGAPLIRHLFGGVGSQTANTHDVDAPRSFFHRETQRRSSSSGDGHKLDLFKRHGPHGEHERPSRGQRTSEHFLALLAAGRRGPAWRVNGVGLRLASGVENDFSLLPLCDL